MNTRKRVEAPSRRPDAMNAIREELTALSADVLGLGRRIERLQTRIATVAVEVRNSTASVPSHRKPESASRQVYGARIATRPELTAKVQSALSLRTKQEAEAVSGTVVNSIEEVLAENIDADGFSLKLGGFGKFSIRHKAGGFRKIPFNGEMKMTRGRRNVRFVALGRLRQLEKRL